MGHVLLWISTSVDGKEARWYDVRGEALTEVCSAFLARSAEFLPFFIECRNRCLCCREFLRRCTSLPKEIGRVSRASLFGRDRSSRLLRRGFCLVARVSPRPFHMAVLLVNNAYKFIEKW